MRKIAPLLIILMLLFALHTAALAEEAGEDDPVENPQSDIDDATEKETRIMVHPFGAKVRLLQLQKALSVNILKAETVINVLQEQEFDTAELVDILDQMYGLLAEVEEADPEAEDSVQAFVEWKYKAINLTKQFREALHTTLDEVTMEQFRELIRNVTSESIQSLGYNIRECIRSYNAYQIQQVFGFIGKADNALVQAYQNGTLSIYQVKLQLCQMIHQMTQEQKYSAFYELRENNIRNRIRP
jgi:hypothetical protein